MQNSLTLFSRRIFWQAQCFAISSRREGIAAALGVLTCGLFILFAVRPLQERIGTLQKEVTTLHDRSSILPIPQKQLNPADQLTQFYQFFPNQNVATESMAKLYNAAIQQNINLEQGEYRLRPARDSKLARYDIVLPVRGGYVQIRKFIAQALIDVPNLSLDAIAFGRQKIGDSAIDAQLRMTLYLRQD